MPFIKKKKYATIVYISVIALGGVIAQMFRFFKKITTHQSLEELLMRTRSSMQNNYKDMAQDYFKKFCKLHDELIFSGSLNELQLEHYKNEREVLTEELKGFTHKDQKPYWH